MEPKQIGRYEIQRRLGRGGMGSLYLARDPGLDRLVAIKLLKDDYQEDQEFRERFAREARALARLGHQNIVIVHDFGEHDGRLFMAMEYINGETLAQRLARTPPLRLAQGLELIEFLCAGLSTAHNVGIVHRDIKPDNIMLDTAGVLKLLDFGIARHGLSDSTHQMTQPGMMMGTFSYMSPEQLLGTSVDVRSDIFATGAVLYEVVALERAFPGNFAAVYHSILETGPIPIDKRVPDVPPSLVRIVERALAREPERRYQDANELRLDLSRVRLRILQEGTEFDDRQKTVVRRAPPTPSRRTKDSQAHRDLVAEQLRLGQEAYDLDHFEEALKYAERAAVVDPNNQEVVDLLTRSSTALDLGSATRLLDDARRHLADGRLQDALTAIQGAAGVVPDAAEADPVREQIRAVFNDVEAVLVREERITSSLERAHASFDKGSYDTALRAVQDALTLDPDRADARDLEQRTKEALRIKREHEEARSDAYRSIQQARDLADEGKLTEAGSALRAVQPPSDTVRRTMADALAELERLQRHRRANALVAEAEAHVVAGAFDRAVSTLDGIPDGEQTDRARQLRATALESAARSRRLEDAIAQARERIDAGDVSGARAQLQDASRTQPSDPRIASLRRALDELEAAAEKRRQQSLDDEAARTADEARARFASGDHAEAIDLLAQSASHPRIDAALQEVRAELDALQRAASQPPPVVDEEDSVRTEETVVGSFHEETIVRPVEQQTIARPVEETIVRPRYEETIVRPVEPRHTPAPVTPTQAPPTVRERPSVETSQRTKRALIGTGLLAAAAGIAVLSILSFGSDRTTDPTSPGSTKTERVDVGADANKGSGTKDKDKEKPDEPPGDALPPPADETGEIRKQIEEALGRENLQRAEGLLTSAVRRFPAESFRTETQAIANLRTAQEQQRTVQDLLNQAAKQTDPTAAIALLTKAQQVAPDDTRIQAQLLRRRQEQLAEGIRRESDEILRALDSGDLDGADRQLKNAESEFGGDSFRSLRQRLADARVRAKQEQAAAVQAKQEQAAAARAKQEQATAARAKQEQAAAALANREQEQVRRVIERFVQAVGAKNKDGIRVLWPTASASFLSTFDKNYGQSWTLGECTIEVSGNTADVTCPITIRIQTRNDPVSEAVSRRFVLSNAGGTWRIDNMTVK